LNNIFRFEFPKLNKISAILSCVEHKWKYCVYVLYFQVYKDQQSVSIAF
jgi:hypothetical protein